MRRINDLCVSVLFWILSLLIASFVVYINDGCGYIHVISLKYSEGLHIPLSAGSQIVLGDESNAGWALGDSCNSYLDIVWDQNSINVFVQLGSTVLVHYLRSVVLLTLDQHRVVALPTQEVLITPDLVVFTYTWQIEKKAHKSLSLSVSLSVSSDCLGASAADTRLTTDWP